MDGSARDPNLIQVKFLVFVFASKFLLIIDLLGSIGRAPHTPLRLSSPIPTVRSKSGGMFESRAHCWVSAHLDTALSPRAR